MAGDKSYHIYTAAELARYHNGEMPAGERRALELAALEDPFLADALEGYEAETAESASNSSNELKDRLAKRVEEKGSRKNSAFFYWRAAAAVIVLVALGWLSFQWLGSNPSNEVAVNEKTEKRTAQDDTAATPADTSRFKATEQTTAKADAKPPTAEDQLKAEKQSSAVAGNAQSALTDVAVLPQSREEAVATQELKDKKAALPPVAAEPNPSDDFVNNERNRSTNANSEKLEESIQRNIVAADKSGKSGRAIPQVIHRTDNAKAMQAAPFAKADSGRTSLPDLVHFSGIIMDEEGNPLPYANISSVRDQVGTYADLKGRFSLLAPDSTLDVQIKSVGFMPKRLPLKASSELRTIQLVPDTVTVTDIVLQPNKPGIIRKGAPVTLDEPEPDGGWGYYDDYVANNLNVPESFRGKPQMTGGVVELSFELDPIGKPVNIKVEKSLCASCDQEAIRLLKEGPKWIRKKAKGDKRLTVSISF